MVIISCLPVHPDEPCRHLPCTEKSTSGPGDFKTMTPERYITANKLDASAKEIYRQHSSDVMHGILKLATKNEASASSVNPSNLQPVSDSHVSHFASVYNAPTKEVAPDSPNPKSRANLNNQNNNDPKDDKSFNSRVGDKLGSLK